MRFPGSLINSPTETFLFSLIQCPDHYGTSPLDVYYTSIS